jgi:hypothetical protein
LPGLSPAHFDSVSEELRAARSRGTEPEEKSCETNQKTTEETKDMNGTALQAVLWIVAGLFLALLVIRRGKRKARG